MQGRASKDVQERLLSYSFCPGGLTPYVIDASLEELLDEDADLFPVPEAAKAVLFLAWGV